MATTTRAVYTPRDTFLATYEGVPITFKKGVTFVREGHELLTHFPDMFEEVRVQYDVEEATAKPGQKR